MIIIVSLLQKAMRNNFKIFFSLDKLHKNGQVDWDEYYQHVLHDKLGLSDKEVAAMESDPASVARDVKETVAEVSSDWLTKSIQLLIG